MEINNLKEVYYDQYCKTCRHKECAEAEDPCHECLTECVNVNSHKPVRWEKIPEFLNKRTHV